MSETIEVEKSTLNELMAKITSLEKKVGKPQAVDQNDALDRFEVCVVFGDKKRTQAVLEGGLTYEQAIEQRDRVIDVIADKDLEAFPVVRATPLKSGKGIPIDSIKRGKLAESAQHFYTNGAEPEKPKSKSKVKTEVSTDE